MLFYIFLSSKVAAVLLTSQKLKRAKWTIGAWEAHVTTTEGIRNSATCGLGLCGWIIADAQSNEECWLCYPPLNSPCVMHVNFNMASKFLSEFSMFGFVVLFVFKSLLKKWAKIAILFVMPQSHARILIHCLWAGFWAIAGVSFVMVYLSTGQQICVKLSLSIALSFWKVIRFRKIILKKIAHAKSI